MNKFMMVGIVVLVLAILVIGGGALILAGAARIGNVKAGWSRKLEGLPPEKEG